MANRATTTPLPNHSQPVDLEPLVYHAAKELFRSKPQMRKIQAISNHLKDCKDELARKLIRDHGLASVAVIAARLAKHEVFESDNRASTYFSSRLPMVRRPPASADTRTATSVVVKTEVPLPPREAPTSNQTPVVRLPSAPAIGWRPPSDGIRNLAQHTATTPTVFPAPVPLPAPDPSQEELPLPFQPQYHLVLQVQQHLEKACFHYGQKHMPEYLQRWQWDCAESIVLHDFLKELSNYLNSHRNEPRTIASTSSGSVDRYIEAVSLIRHFTLHRHRLSAEKTENLLRDVEDLATFLQEDIAVAALSSFHRGIRGIVENLKIRDKASQATFDARIEYINAKRAGLDKHEEAAILDKLSRDSKSQSLAQEEMEAVIWGKRKHSSLEDDE